MQKLFLFALLLCLLGRCKSIAPPQYRNYLTDNWEDLRLAPVNERPEPTDSMAIVYSDRAFYPERKKFLGNFLDSTGMCRFFLLTVQSGKWKVFSIPSLEAGMAYLPKHQNVLVFVEGMGKSFPLAISRAISMTIQYQLSVVMMDYPSLDPDVGMGKNLRCSRKNSFQSCPHLLDLLAQVQSYKREKAWKEARWTLFLHSMGNIMLKRLLEERLDTTLSPGLFDNVVLNAPCVNQKGHSKWLGNSALGKHYILHYNSADKQLNGYMLLTWRRQLGQRPRPPLACNTQYVDFHPLVGSRHSTFVEIQGRAPIHPHIKTYYYSLLNGILPNFKDSAQFGPAWKKLGVSLK